MASEIDGQMTMSEDGTNQYLTFALAGEEYGVDILKVQEIKGYVPTTRLPNSPPHIAGVLNLRGVIVPLLDLRSKFGLASREYDQFSAIIVLLVADGVVGVIVDSVSEVVTIDGANIQPPPDFARGDGTNMLSGIAKTADKLIILLDVETVFKDETPQLAFAA